MYQQNGHPSHARRRSSKVSPIADDGGWIKPAQTRTPKLESGVFDSPSLTRRRPAQQTSVWLRIANSLWRLARSPRGMVVLGSLAFLWLCTSYVRANSHHLAKRPVHPAFLPIIKQGGKLVGYVSPSAANRVQSWHDYQVATNPNRPLTEAEIEARAQHTFHPNGLLLVNPRGRHPISVLIERAEKRWKDKVARQSRTLAQAVSEYKRRYRRNPPKGFDDWWNFCEENNVQLRDEYDQINHDLAPHWALEAHDSRHRNRVMQERDHTFTAAFAPGKPVPSLHGPYADIKRATDVQGLLKLYAGRVPRPVNITFIMDDNPAVMLPYMQKDRMVELGQQGEYYGPSEYTEPDDPDLSNFAQACPPNSPLRRAERGEFVVDYSGEAQRSFIWNHQKAADLCQHPEIRQLHGHTMQQGVPLSPLVPLFSFAKTRLHADILVTPLEQYEEVYTIGYEPPWEQKSMNKLLWRGSTTGVEFDRHTPWRQSQRARLHMMSQNMEGEKAVLWSQGSQLRESNMSIEALNHLYMDTFFAGALQQCDPETCEIMTKTLTFKPTIGLDESNQYKYYMDVDGNGWSGRFHRLMSTRSVVLKSTAFPEWYADRVEPWVHYVPVKIDYSDVYDIMTYFVGTPDGRGSHDSVAERLGAQGKEWARTHWRMADMAAYMYRLTLEYSRILNHDDADNSELDYFLPPDVIVDFD